MDIAKKYEDVVAERDSALAREAALRDELAEVKRHVKQADMVFNMLRIACDATGETTALVYSKLGDMLNAKAEAEALQQRLTVAEQLLGDWYAANANGEILVADSAYKIVTETAEMLHEEALKPAAEPRHICKGCGAKGWTANCAQCVPY